MLVYQEQVMQSAQIIAGYTLGGADILRHAMGKKIKSVMDAQKQVFIDGARQTNNIDAKTATAIRPLEKFAQYAQQVALRRVRDAQLPHRSKRITRSSSWPRC